MFNELSEIHQHRSLLANLIRKDLKSRYRGSVLGWLWSMLHPLLMFLVIYLIFSTFFAPEVENYGSYVITGVLVFQLFSSCTTRCSRAFLEFAQIIRRNQLPLTVFPYAIVLASIVHFLFAAIPVLAIILVLGVGPSINLFFFPLVLLLTAILLAGIGLCLAVTSVFFQDLLHAYDVILLVLMYASAIFYPVEIVPVSLHWIFQINPLFHLIELYRSIFLVEYTGFFVNVTYVLGFSALFMAIATWVYNRKSQKLVYLI